MIPAISLKSTICCSGWQLAGAAISKASFEVPFSPPCWGALKDIAGNNQGFIDKIKYQKPIFGPKPQYFCTNTQSRVA